jgi:hypothetical protein
MPQVGADLRAALGLIGYPNTMDEFPWNSVPPGGRPLPRAIRPFAPCELIRF